MNKRRSKFSAEFKQEAVALVKRSGKSANQVARELGISQTSLSRWIREVQASPGEENIFATQEELRRLRKEVERLRMERDILKKANGLLRQGIPVRYQFIEAEKARFPVIGLCRVLQVSRSGFYAWQARPESPRVRQNRRLELKIRAIHRGSRRNYGSPRVHDALREAGEHCGRHRVARLMRAAGLRAKTVRKFRATTDAAHTHPVAENLLAQGFSAQAPNARWVSDITYVPTGEGWLYLAVVLDLFSRAVVGWAMAPRMTAQLVRDALTMALWRRGRVAGLLLHSDRGCQYASDDYQQLLWANGIVCSMSRKGNCYDNAAMESFFGTLKRELVHHERYRTREAAMASIFEYIEVFYNHQRKHSAINYQAPMVYERQRVSA
ncbi:MAG: IS3 family transposase [Acidiferrobacterales bacterium]